MRDIRGDLQDRASFLEEQISAAEAQFEKRVEQLKREHQAKIEDLETELEAVKRLMEGEQRRLGSAAPVQDERRASPPQEAAPRRHAPIAHAPEAEPHEHEVAVAEPRRAAPMPAPEADYQHHAAPQAEYPRHPAPEPEQYRRAPAAEVVPPRRAAPSPEVEYHRRAAPMPAQEAEYEPRPAPPQVYRRAPIQPAQEAEPRRAAAAQQPQQPPLADFLIRKLSEIGAMTLDDLCHLAVQEGYFANGEIADRGVHVTLMNVAKAGFVRQLPNGAFAPATVMDTIRLRRAI